MSVLYGVPIDVECTLLDRAEVAHALLVAGPYLRCETHNEPQVDTVAAAVALVSHRRSCGRVRVAWQRRMLADERAADVALRYLPAELKAYLVEQTARHGARLDAALRDGAPDARVRRRWHTMGWRAAPGLAARYQAVGVEAGVAFLAMRRGIEPEAVPALLDDSSSVIAQALKKTKRRGFSVEQLDLQFRSVVTDDFPYEPLV